MLKHNVMNTLLTASANILKKIVFKFLRKFVAHLESATAELNPGICCIMSTH